MSENKTKIDRSKYIIEQKENEEITKHYTEVNGADIKIRKNKNCKIFILDNCGGMFVDDCENCKIIVGPIEGSIMVRTSKNCNISVIARQIRFRDCENIKCFAYCPSDPAVESSFNIFFAPYNSFFPHLKELFVKANFIKEKNHINNPYDFTPDLVLGNGATHFLNLPDAEFKIEQIPDYDKPIEEMWNGYSESEPLIKGKINLKINNNEENKKNKSKNIFTNKNFLIIIISLILLLFSLFIKYKK
jgi:hypothetical protein